MAPTEGSLMMPAVSPGYSMVLYSVLNEALGDFPTHSIWSRTLNPPWS